MSGLQADLVLLIERGGIVMLPLLAVSIVSLTLVVERACFWLAVHRPGALRGRLARLLALNEALRSGDRARAGEIAASDRSPYGHLARRLLAHGATQAVAVEAVEAQRPKIDRFMVTLSTIITAAPMLGILGTVTGIIQSFSLLGARSTSELADPSAVSAGIAEALLTTAVGLVIALMTLFPYMIFRGQVERAIGRMESIIAAAQQGEQAVPPARRSDTAVAPGRPDGDGGARRRPPRQTEAEVAGSS